MKKVFMTLITITLIIACSIGAFSASGITSIKASLNKLIHITYNGDKFEPKDNKGTILSPITYKGVTYIPLKNFCDVMGVNVNIKAKNEIELSPKVTIKQDKEFEAKIAEKMYPIDENYEHVVYCNNAFYAIRNGSVYCSTNPTDASDWNKVFTPPSATCIYLQAINQHLYANVKTSKVGHQVYESSDGLNWHKCEYDSASYQEEQMQFEVLGVYDGKFYTKSWFDILSSKDGVKWKNEGYFGAGETCIIPTSDALILYGIPEQRELPPTPVYYFIGEVNQKSKPSNKYYMTCVAHGDGNYLGITDTDGKLLTSSDGMSWNVLTEDRLFNNITFDGQRFIATGFNNKVKDWTTQRLYFIENINNEWIINEMTNPYNGRYHILSANNKYYLYK